MWLIMMRAQKPISERDELSRERFSNLLTSILPMASLNQTEPFWTTQIRVETTRIPFTVLICIVSGFPLPARLMRTNILDLKVLLGGRRDRTRWGVLKRSQEAESCQPRRKFQDPAEQPRKRGWLAPKSRQTERDLKSPKNLQGPKVFWESQVDRQVGQEVWAKFRDKSETVSTGKRGEKEAAKLQDRGQERMGGLTWSRLQDRAKK